MHPRPPRPSATLPTLHRICPLNNLSPSAFFSDSGRQRKFFIVQVCSLLLALSGALPTSGNLLMRTRRKDPGLTGRCAIRPEERIN